MRIEIPSLKTHGRFFTKNIMWAGGCRRRRWRVMVAMGFSEEREGFAMGMKEEIKWKGLQWDRSCSREPM